jgi:hypothetical protein
VKDRQDFEVEQTKPSSIRDIVIGELASTTYKGKTIPKPEDINTLLKRVYEHIERQALEVYKSNEPWALKAWAYSNLLKDTIADEANQQMVEELISPIMDWQDQGFDPIAHFQKRLTRKSQRTREAYMQTAARFVAREGRKKYYTDEDVEDYQAYAMQRYPNQNSYYQECRRLLIFLQKLPGGVKWKDKELPLENPEQPAKKSMYRPAASLEEIEQLVWACVLDPIPSYMVMRLLCATVYGRRRGELVDFDIHLNGENSTVKFVTLKRGEESPHPIPQSLVPIFDAPNRSVGGVSLQRKLAKVCRKAGVRLPPRAGYHWIRRRVSRTVRKACGSDIDAYRFMRWAEPEREWGMLSWYEDEEEYGHGDMEILEKHPVVKMWEQACPYILKFNRYYQDCKHKT